MLLKKWNPWGLCCVVLRNCFWLYLCFSIIFAANYLIRRKRPADRAALPNFVPMKTWMKQGHIGFLTGRFLANDASGVAVCVMMESSFCSSICRGMFIELRTMEDNENVCISNKIVVNMVECNSLSTLDQPIINDLYIGLQRDLGILEGVVRKYEYAIGYFRDGGLVGAIDANRVVRIQ